MAQMYWRVFFCLTPLLLLPLLHHAEDLQGPAKHKDLVSKLSYQMAMELFDVVVDMIELVLDDNGHDRGRLFCEPASPSLEPRAASLFLRASKDSRQKIQKWT